MQIETGFRELVARAEREVEALSPTETALRMQQDGTLLVDLRDIRELKREGTIPGSVHVPRGMLEFWIDPDCPYFKDFFADAKEIVFYCNKGWRSALAAQTAQQMGISNVKHMSGGLESWLSEGRDVDKS